MYLILLKAIKKLSTLLAASHKEITKVNKISRGTRSLYLLLLCDYICLKIKGLVNSG